MARKIALGLGIVGQELFLPFIRGIIHTIFPRKPNLREKLICRKNFLADYCYYMATKGHQKTTALNPTEYLVSSGGGGRG
jgi:hypothetical protein